MGNWDIPRKEAVQTVVELARSGYPIPKVAQYVVEEHFTGKSIPHAVGHLTEDAFAEYYSVHGARTREQEEIHRMANTLRSEGWGLINEPGRGFMWRHPETGNYVGNGGGLFRTFAEATRRTFASQTRELMQSAQS